MVLVACPVDTPVGRRDLAILTVLVQLALRAGEVASLQLEDIQWRAGTVSVRGAKSHRQRLLPLSDEVGTALVKYLRDGRPHSDHRAVFLTARAPHRPLSPSAISTCAARAMERAGVSAARHGSHVFRHTAATRMLRAGATFKDIADVLGHARLETTGIYAKLDLEALARVALPWPEVAP